MASNAKDCEERNRQLKEEREAMVAHFQELKGQMNKLRENERDRLTKLTLESNGAIKELKRNTEKVPIMWKMFNPFKSFMHVVIVRIYGDKVAQLVRCRTSNQRVAGSIPGRGTLVCPWARQFIPYCFSLPSCKMGT